MRSLLIVFCFFSVSHAQTTISGTVFSNQGSTNIGAGVTVSISVNGGAIVGTSPTDGSGNYSVPNVTLGPGDVVTAFIDDQPQDGVTVTVVDGTAPASFNIYQNTLILRHDNGGSISNTELDTADNLADSDLIFSVTGGDLTVTGGVTLIGSYSPGPATVSVGGDFRITTGSFIPGTSTLRFTAAANLVPGGSSFYNLTIDCGSGVTVRPSTSIVVNNNFDLISGTYNSQQRPLSVTGNLAIQDNGFLTLRGSDSLTLGSASTSPGSTVEYAFNGDTPPPHDQFSYSYGNLRILFGGTASFPDADLNVQGNLYLQRGTPYFDDDKNVTVGSLTVGDTTVVSSLGTGNLTIGGNVTIGSSNLLIFDSPGGTDDIQIRSTVPGVTRNWNVNPSSTVRLTNVDVQDQTATHTVYATSSTDSGNNTNWVFNNGISFSGTVYTDRGITNIGSGKTISVAPVGTSVVASAVTDASGNFTFSNIEAAANDTLLVFIDDEVENGAAFFKLDAAQAPPTSVDIYQNYLSMVGAQAIDYGGDLLSVADDFGDADIASLFTAGSSLVVNDGISLYVSSGTTYSTSLRTSIGTSGDNSNLILDGTLTFTTFSGRNLEVYGDVEVSGSLSYSGFSNTFTNEEFVLTGDFTNNSGAALNIRGPLHLRGVNQTFNDSQTTFFDILSNTQTKTVTIVGSVTSSGSFTNTENLTLNGGTLRVQDDVTNTASIAGTATLESFGSNNVDYSLTNSFDLDLLVNRSTSLDTLRLQSSINLATSSLTIQEGGLQISGSQTATVGGAFVVQDGGRFVVYEGAGYSSPTFQSGSAVWYYASTANSNYPADLISANAYVRISAGAAQTVNLPDVPFASSGFGIFDGGTLNLDNDQTVTADGGVSVGAGSVLSLVGTASVNLGGEVFVDNGGALRINSVTSAVGESEQIQIRSTTPGVRRNWRSSGTGRFEIVDVDLQDQQADGTSPATITALSSVDSGNNLRFDFIEPISGRVYRSDRTTPVNGINVSASVNGTAVSATGLTVGAGNYSLPSLVISPGDVITIFIDDEAERGATVTVHDGANAAVINIYEDYLTLRHDNGGALTNANLALSDNSGDTDISDLYSLTGSDLFVLASNGLYLEDNYTPGGNITTPGWTGASGTFTAGTHSVIFNATSGTNLLTEDDSFYDIIVSDGGGSATLELGSNLSVGNDLTISDGILSTDDTNDHSIGVTRHLSMTGGQLQGNDSTITIGGNVSFSGAESSTGLNRASVVLTSAGSLAYTSLSLPSDNGVFNLSVGQSGATTTLNNDFSVRNLLAVGSGELTGAGSLYLVAANPLSFNASSRLSVASLKFSRSGSMSIPTLVNGYESELHVAGLGTVVNQAGNVRVVPGLRIDADNQASGAASWSTNGFDLVVLGDVRVGSTAGDTALKSLNISNSSVEVGGDLVVLDVGGGTTQATVVSSGSSLTLNGASTQNLTLSGSALNSVIVNNSHASELVTFLDAASIAESLTISDGQVEFGAGDLFIQDTAGSGSALILAAGTSLANAGTGNLTLGGGVLNDGSIVFNSSDDSGNGLSILSNSAGVQRNWQGTGSFSFTDVSVQDQRAVGGVPATISAASSTNLGNNLNWVFDGAVLNSASVSFNTLRAGLSSTASFGFVNSNPVPANGRIAITFPAGFDIAGVTSITSADIDGTLSVQSISGQTLTLLRAGGTQIGIGTAVDDLAISGIVNPSATGLTGIFSLETQDNIGTAIDSGSLSGVSIVPDTYLLSGVVRDSDGGALSGVLVDGGALGSNTTDSSGAFSFGALSAGASYTLSFSLTNYSFSSVSGVLTSDTNLSVVGSSTGSTVSGVVTLSNQTRTPLGGAIVTDGSVSTVTGADGTFTLSGVTSSNAVYVELEGYEFEELTSGAELVFVLSNSEVSDGIVDLDLVFAHSEESGITRQATYTTDTNIVFLATPALATTSYSAWNTFIDMTAILELSNNHSSETTFTVILRDAVGSIIGNVPIKLGPNVKRDIILNDLLGRVDEYGIVEIVAPHTSYSGRVTQYRTNLQGVFEFAYATELSIGMAGDSAVPFNSFQPSENNTVRDFQVTNWLTIINLENVVQGYKITRFRSDGVELRSDVFYIAPFGRADIEGGHETGENAGFHEIEPLDQSGKYLAFLTRYGDIESGYHYASNFVSTKPAYKNNYLSVSRLNNSSTWLEISNVSDELEEISLEIISEDGTQLHQEVFGLPAKTQRHFNASVLLGNSLSGFAKLAYSSPDRVITHKVSYFTANDGIIDALDARESSDVFGDSLDSSYNTFLKSGNWLKLVNITDAFQEISLSIDGEVISYRIAPRRTELIPLGLLVEPDSYGEFRIDAPEFGAVLSEVIRTQGAVSSDEAPLFAIGTAVR